MLIQKTLHFDTTFANEAAKVTEPLFVTKDIVIRFQKGENGYELTADNEDLYNVATTVSDLTRGRYFLSNE